MLRESKNGLPKDDNKPDNSGVDGNAKIKNEKVEQDKEKEKKQEKDKPLGRSA